MCPSLAQGQWTSAPPGVYAPRRLSRKTPAGSHGEGESGVACPRKPRAKARRGTNERAPHLSLSSLSISTRLSDTRIFVGSFLLRFVSFIKKKKKRKRDREDIEFFERDTCTIKKKLSRNCIVLFYYRFVIIYFEFTKFTAIILEVKIFLYNNK